MPKVASVYPAQLRWGDYDSHDIERYTRAKFLDYTTDNMVRAETWCFVLGSLCLCCQHGW